MRLTWIIEVLRAFANRLWPSARRPTSPSGPTATGPLSKPPDAVPDDAVTDPDHPAADDIPSGTPDHDDGVSEEQPDRGDIDDENGITEGEQFTPPDSVDQPPRSDDHERCRAETDKHPEGGGPEGISDGNARAGKPPASKRKPRKIGGRRVRQPPKQSPEQRSQSRSSHPELICRRVPASTTWEIILRADEECQLAAVHLDGEPLDRTAHECRVPSLTRRLIVSCQYEQRYEVPLFEDDPLIFKLRKNWFGEGRKIARITNGYFIIIVPSTWQRTGRAPVEPDGCADTEFLAHYFYRDATATHERVDGFHEWSGSPVAIGIELTGRRVFDDSNEGDLFVGDALSLKPSPDVVSARVGEETKHGWGQTFTPDEQSLSEVLNDREGRFFLRVYDSEAQMLDSVAFRYLRNLERIRVNEVEYAQDTVLIPSPTGYPPTEARFVGADGSTIPPILTNNALQGVAPSGALVIPPRPDADRVSCRIETDASGVDIVLDLPRIWWRLEDDRADPSAWRDMPFTMTRQEFRKHAHSNVMLVLLSRRFSSVCAGFDDERALPFGRISEDDRIPIPLAHFVDYAQIDRRLNDDVRFNVEWAGEIVPLVMISADPMPEILSFSATPATIIAGEETILKWVTRNGGDARVAIDPDIGMVDSDGTFTVRPTDTTTYVLTLGDSGADGISSTVTVAVEQVGGSDERLAAQVMSIGCGWRNGKGFSFRELQDAGLTLTDAMDRSIPIDKRRRTSHRANVGMVRSMFDV